MRTLVAAAIVSLLCACATTPESRIERAPEAFAKLPPEQQAKVKAGEVGVGFGETATRLALGEPDRISERESAEGKVRVWFYYTPSSNIGTTFCPGFFNRYTFSTVCYVTETVLEERIRVSFKDGKVTAVERVVR